MEVARLGGKLRGKGLGRLPGAQQLYRLLLPRRNTLRRVKVLDFEMWVDLRDIGDLTPSLLTKGFYQPQMTKVIREEVKPGMTCIDVGANIGYFTLLMSKLGGTVYSYEPELTNYGLLVKNLTLNETNSVYTILSAVSSKQGVGTLQTSSRFFGSYHLSKGVLGQSTNINTLDAAHKNTKVDLVKVDTQGAELQVLEGMSKVIEKNPSMVMVWLYLPGGLRRFDCSPLKFLEAFEKLGFRLWDIDEKRKKVIPLCATQILSKYKDKQATHLLVRR